MPGPALSIQLSAFSSQHSAKAQIGRGSRGFRGFLPELDRGRTCARLAPYALLAEC